MILIVLALLLCSGAFLVSSYHAATCREIIGYCKGRPKGYIYFFTGDDPTVVKIGRTNNLLSRLRAHRTALPNGIVVLGVVPVWDDVWAEGYIHRKYAEQRKSKRAEWFYLTLSLRWYINAVRDEELTIDTQNLLTRTEYH